MVIDIVEPIIRFTNVHKSFYKNGYAHKVLNDISLHVNKGEVVTLLGKSGCGKSTLLNMVGGFMFPDEGEVLLKGKNVTKPIRDCVILFQQQNLLPWRTVLDNVLIGLNGERRKIENEARNALQFVGLSEYLHSYPHELSGGMKQRVAIARSFAMKPDVILMDEPFAALDTFNRYHLQDELIRLQQDHLSILLVTHDIDEAVYVSDRIYMMNSNPGDINRTIRIELPKPRDRSHQDFYYYRNKIFELFQLSSDERKPEYYI